MALSRGRGGSTPPRLPPIPRRSSGGAGGYSRRVANYARKIGKDAASLTAEERRAARGHRREAQEKRERRSRIKEQFGVTPERLVKLRRAAEAHMRDQLGRVPFAARHRPDFDEVRDRLRAIGGEALDMLIGMDVDTIRNLAHLSYEELIEAYPEFENDEGINPFWYH